MITNVEKLINYITRWIKSYAVENGKKSLIIASPLYTKGYILSSICSKTNLSLYIVNTSYAKPAIKNATIIDYGEKKTIDTLITNNQSLIIANDRRLIEGAINAREGSLYLFYKYVSDCHNGLLIGAESREEIFARSYTKNCLADLLPFADLYSSEINEIGKYLDLNDSAFPKTKGFLHEEIEWADREDKLHNIVSQNQDPAKHKEWVRYSAKQRKIIAKLNSIETDTRHKQTNTNILKIRDRKDLVR